MRAIVTGDLHLTGRKEDEYRWKIFDYLATRNFEVLVILGDLCDAKDCHAASLVNRVVKSLLRFAEAGQEVHVLMGNHDYSDPDCPFFQFVHNYPNCYYHDRAQIWEIGNMRWAFFPHSRTPENYVDDMRRGAKELGVDYTLCHQVFDGALSESGRALKGCDAGLLEGAGRILAGDVHVPQKVGPVEYIGAPYPIKFGDDYEPRLAVVDNVSKTFSYIYPPYMQKLVLEVTEPDQIEYEPRWKEGDQVKVVLTLRRADFGRWEQYRKRIRRLCDRNGLVLCGVELKERVRQRLTEESKPRSVPVSHEDQFDAYCRQAAVDKSDVSVGRKLLEV